MIKTIACAGAAMLIALTAAAQNRYTPIAPIPLGDTLLTLPTSHIPSEGTWEVKFTHRFNQSIDQGSGSDRIHTLFGLDSNADVALGLSYAPHPDLQFSFMRSNALDDIELAAKYIVVQQAAAIPFALAVRGGADWRTEQNLKDRTSFFAQLIISRQLGNRAEIFALPMFVTNAGRAVSGSSSQALFDHATNMPVGIAIMVRPALSIVGEFIPKNRDLPDSTRGDFGWALGLKRAIGGHYFEIMLTNSNSTMADQYVTTTYQGAALDRGDLHLGFNIERRFGRR
ncbi:MAG: hypothetical protein QOI24_3207 [Acidobacteriota bacterium]|jgi:hypothetical protein|nr:hypothetical protein [Acidobacteriota bacterium]